MSDEQLKVQKKLVISSGKVCIVHDSSVCGESAKLGNLSDHSFAQIRNAVAIRQSQPSEGARKTDICGAVPDQFNPDVHGVHWECTRNFTNTADFIVIGGEKSESVRRSLRSVSE